MVMPTTRVPFSWMAAQSPLPSAAAPEEAAALEAGVLAGVEAAALEEVLPPQAARLRARLSAAETARNFFI